MRRLVVGVLAAVAACGGGGSDTDPIQFGTIGPLTGDSGRGGGRFGAASASQQIEDMNVHTDWWAFTAPTSMGGQGQHTFVGDATRGYSMVDTDMGLVKE